MIIKIKVVVSVKENKVCLEILRLYLNISLKAYTDVNRSDNYKTMHLLINAPVRYRIQRAIYV